MEKIKYSESELQSKGDIFSICTEPGANGMRLLPRYSTPVTPKENFLAAARKETPVWLPTFVDTTLVCPACYPDAVARGFVMGAEMMEYMDDSKKGGKDAFGIEWEWVPVAQGSMVRPGKAALGDISEWKEKITMPDVDSWDWAGSAAKNRPALENSEDAVVGWIFTGFFERLISILDFENAAVAIIDDDSKDDIHEFFGECVKAYKKILKHYKEDLCANSVFFHDDWGSQRAPFFSINACREMIVPYLKQVVDYAHEIGMVFEFHCCGCNELLVPAMIEAGCDIWAPQPGVNDSIDLFNKFGDKIMIGINTEVPMSISDEEAYKLGKSVIDGLGDKLLTNRCYWYVIMDVNIKYREAFYVESRKILG